MDEEAESARERLAARFERKRMRNRILFIVLWVFVLPAAVFADVDKIVEPLSCGIYDQQVAPFIQEELETQSSDPVRYTMDMTMKSGKRLTVQVKNVSIKMAGERNHVSVFLDGKPFAKTSHQDVPLYLEVHVDAVRYRIICTRNEPTFEGAEK